MIRGTLARIRSLWRGVGRSAEVDAEILEELRTHLELRAEDLMRQGLSPAAARRRAGLEFGSLDGYREAGRVARGLRAFDAWRISWLDVKLGARMLAKYPGLTLVGGLAMAFAIGAGAAAFELVTAALHPSLPLAGGERIIGIRLWDAVALRSEDRALHDLARWRATLETVDDLGAFRPLRRNLIVEGAGVEPIQLAEISASAFRVARVPPLLGRTLVDADERAGAPLVAVIGERVWRDRFARDPDILGLTVRLGRAPATVVGVMPETFAFPFNNVFWMPLRLDARAYGPRQGPGIRVFGRLAEGVSIERARAELAALGARAAADLPHTHEHLQPELQPYPKSIFPMRIGRSLMVGGHSINLALLLFLVLVCTNVGALVLARTATRASEIVVRSALGASRGRIMVQLFAEALVLLGVAAAVGLAAAEWGLGWGVGVFEAVNERLPFWIDDSLSPSTLLYASVLAVLGAVLVGLVPAASLTRGMGARLQRVAVGGSGARFGKLVMAILVAQVAFTVVCLPLAVDTGLDAARIGQRVTDIDAQAYLTATLGMDRETPPDVATDVADARFRTGFAAAYRELARRLTAEPGVRAVSFADHLPGGYHPRRRVEIDDPVPAVEHRVQVASVDVGFFDALGARIVAGRGFHAGDLGSASRPVVVNRAFAREVLGEQNAVGRRVRHIDPEDQAVRPMADAAPGPWHEIVGVVAGLALNGDPDLAHDAGMYLPVSPAESDAIRLAVHVRGDPMILAPRVRDLAIAVDPALRLDRIRSLDDVQNDLLMTYGFWLRILLLASGIALLLAVSGIYSVMAFGVARRTREIGVRVALGAGRRAVVALVLGRALVQTGLGTTIGVGLLIVLNGGRVSPGFLALVALGVGPILGAGLLSAIVPTRRALRVEPTEALRADG